MAVLHVGDRVEVTSSFFAFKNEKGIIVATNSAGNYLVSHDHAHRRMHTGDGVLSRKNGWWYFPSQLRRISSIEIRDDISLDEIFL